MWGRQHNRLAIKSRRQHRTRRIGGRFETLEPRMLLTSYVVDSLADSLLPADLTTVPADGLLTLREALAAANTNQPVGDAPAGSAAGGDTIHFAPHLFGAIELDGAPLPIEGGGDLQIVGPGAEILTLTMYAVYGSSIRVITHTSGAAHLSGLTIQGGGIEHHGGALTLERINIHGGEAEEGGGLASYGGNVVIRDSRLEWNNGYLGGAIYNNAGGTSTAPSMILERTVIADNRAAYGESVKGGGIYNENSFLVVRDSTIEWNTADFGGSPMGGGVYNLSAGGGVRIERSTIANNFAESAGGGVYSVGTAGAVQETSLEVSNSTISGNRSWVEGGGIYNGAHSALSLVDSTIAFNNSSNGRGGGVWNESGLLRLSNSIVIGNSAFHEAPDFGNATTIDTAQPAPVFNIVGVPNGYNDPRLFDSANNNATGVAADVVLVMELADNGGPTRTHALQTTAGNPAIDEGSSRVIIDQRGMPIRNQRDIGAYEVQVLLAPSKWTSGVTAASQWGPGQGLRFGVGFDLGDESIQKEPEFLGFTFDPDPVVLGKVFQTLIGRFGGELRVDLEGRVGLEYGYYVDSGTLDVDYSGVLTYNTTTTSDGATRLQTALDILDGALHTISPRVGAYADLVIELEALIGAKGCFVGCYAGSFPISIDANVPLFSINRQDENGVFDGEIRFGGEAFQKKKLDANKDAQIIANDINLRSDWILQAAEFTDDDIRTRLQDAADDSATRQQLLDEIRRRAAIDRAQGQRALDRAATEAEKDAARAKIEQAKANDQKAMTLQKTADSRVKNLVKGGKFGGGEIIQFHVGESAGDQLLGAEITVSAGLGIDGIANISADLGSLALTLPDIQLSDALPDETGVLSATTDDFGEGSLLDDKRQLAKLRVDVGALLGPMVGIPGGKFSASLGPLSLGVTTVSYNLEPQLNVNQNVQVVPYVQNARFGFSEIVDVRLNGVLHDDVTQISFTPGDTIEILPTSGEVTVTPYLQMGNRFTNQLGLDIDLGGVLEAFALNLSLFGKTLIDVGPLLRLESSFGEFDLGKVFDKTFELETTGQTLEPFIIGASQPVAGLASNPLLVTPGAAGDGGASALFDVAADSGSSGDPLLADLNVTFTPNQVQAGSDAVIFVAAPLLDADGTLYTEIQVAVSGNTLKSIGVIRDGLQFQSLPGGSTVELEQGVLLDVDTTLFRLTGFDGANLSGSATALLALTFESPASETTIAVARSAPVLTPVLTGDDERVPPVELDRPVGVNRALVEQANPVFVTSDDALDVNGDGVRDALSDGILVLRYLSGFEDAALIEGIDLSQGKRTTAAEVREYLAWLEGQGRLDIDDNGESDPLTDGILILRQQFGFVGDVLVEGALGAGAKRIDAGEIAAFVRGENIVLVGGIGFNIPEILDRTGGDPLGLKNVNQVADHAVPGSSAWAPSPAVVGGDGSRMYALNNFGQEILVTQLVRNDVVLATVSDGSPTGGLLHDYGLELTYPGTNDLNQEAILEFSNSIETVETTRTLGVQAPIYLDAPDAAAYRFRVENGFAFDSLSLDLSAGDAVLMDPVFDLYLPGSTPQWMEVDLSQPLSLPAGTAEFQLYSRPLRNQVAHRATNRVTLPDGTPGELQPAVSDFRVPFGFTFLGGAPGVVPEVALLAVERQPVHEPPALLASDFPFSSTHQFTLRRQGADALLWLDAAGSEPQQAIQIASATRVQAVGTAASADVFIVDASAGPLHMLPGVFRGSEGEIRDSLPDVLRVIGSGVHVDLAESVDLFDVETIDIRGAGVNSVAVSALSIYKNLGADQTFYVVLDPGEDQHNVDAGHGWTFAGEVEKGGAAYDLYSQLVQPDPDSPMVTVFAAIYRQGLPAPLDTAGAPIGNVFSTFATSNFGPAGADGTLQQVFEGGFAQTIGASPATLIARAGTSFQFDVVYDTDPLHEQLGGIGFRLHFDSTQVTLDEAATAATLLGAPIALIQVQNDTANLDDDTQTDKVLLVGLSSGAAPDFPGIDTLPATLFTAQFTAAANFQGTTIRFSKSSIPSGATFEAASVSIAAALPWQNPGDPLDVDASGLVTIADLLAIVQVLRTHGPHLLPDPPTPSYAPPPYVDCNGDGWTTMFDLLAVVQYLRGQIAGSGNGEGEMVEVGLPPAAGLDLQTPFLSAIAGYWRPDRPDRIKILSESSRGDVLIEVLEETPMLATRGGFGSGPGNGDEFTFLRAGVELEESLTDIAEGVWLTSSRGKSLLA
jgi:hypothetical protein